MIRCSRFNKRSNFFLQNVTSTPKYQKTKKLSIAGKPFAFKECSFSLLINTVAAYAMDKIHNMYIETIYAYIPFFLDIAK